LAKILVVDDEIYMRDTLYNILKDEGHEVKSAENGDIAWKLLEKEKFDIVLTDMKMPSEISGFDLLRKIKEKEPLTIVLIMTAYGSIENAVEAMKVGAYDYLQKPFSPDELILRVNKGIQDIKINKELKYFREQQDSLIKNFEIIGESKAIKEVKKHIYKISQTDFPVLITGESGTGKELVARQIHLLSQRKDEPFIAINVSALNPNLIESELFGYEKGAFTGATKRHLGKFELADNGTLFLDEIGELPLEIQVKLLRVLQEKEFYRVGGNQTITTNTRIIAATNKDLKKLIKENKFREDLYFRLNVYPIHVPPLREREEDIRLLFSFFIEKYSKQMNIKTPQIDEKIFSILEKYQWKGNIRELENLSIRILIRLEHNIISNKDIPEEYKYPFGKEIQDTSDINKILDTLIEIAKKEQLENETLFDSIKRIIFNFMYQKIGEKKKAAEILGISRPTFFKWIKE